MNDWHREKRLEGPVLTYEAQRRVPHIGMSTVLLVLVLGLLALNYVANEMVSLLCAHLWNQSARGLTPDPFETNITSRLWPITEWAIMVLPPAVALSLVPWMYAAHRRLRRWGKRLRYTDGDAVWGWILPGVVLIRPFEVLKEIYTQSRDVPGNQFTPFVSGWWALWLAGNFLTLLKYLFFSKADWRAADDNIAYWIWNALTSVLYLSSDLCLMATVIRTARGQQRHALSVSVVAVKDTSHAAQK